MKLFLLMTLTLAAMAQDAKVATGPTPVPVPAERALTSEESLKLQLSQSRILRLQDKYKIAEYQSEVTAIAAEQNAVWLAACKSIGIPDDKIQTECRINTGVDADGKPVLGPDNKPLKPRVWRELPKDK